MIEHQTLTITYWSTETGTNTHVSVQPTYHVTSYPVWIDPIRYWEHINSNLATYGETPDESE